MSPGSLLGHLTRLSPGRFHRVTPTFSGEHNVFGTGYSWDGKLPGTIGPMTVRIGDTIVSIPSATSLYGTSCGAFLADAIGTGTRRKRPLWRLRLRVPMNGASSFALRVGGREPEPVGLHAPRCTRDLHRAPALRACPSFRAGTLWRRWASQPGQQIADCSAHGHGAQNARSSARPEAALVEITNGVHVWIRTQRGTYSVELRENGTFRTLAVEGPLRVDHMHGDRIVAGHNRTGTANVMVVSR
ncbi:MAG: hypothetical protein QOE09_3535, partial [Ilumatobacteraceae bacterium]